MGNLCQRRYKQEGEQLLVDPLQQKQEGEQLLVDPLQQEVQQKMPEQKEEEQKQAEQQPLEQPAKPLKSWELRRLKQKQQQLDLSIKNKTNEKIVRNSGSINGSAFQIENNKNCQIFLFDHTSQIFVDDCENCTIFIGPASSSLFLRSSTNCIVHVACGQFRSRDLRKSTVYLYCQSQPIIENTSELILAPFQYYYPGLEEHFLKANKNIWNNNWSDIHNFTPPQPGEHHYTLLPGIQYPIKEFQIGENQEYLLENLIVPNTLGFSKHDYPNKQLLVYKYSEELNFLAKRINKTDVFKLKRCWVLTMDMDKLKEIGVKNRVDNVDKVLALEIVKKDDKNVYSIFFSWMLEYFVQQGKDYDETEWLLIYSNNPDEITKLGHFLFPIY